MFVVDVILARCVALPEPQLSRPTPSLNDYLWIFLASYLTFHLLTCLGAIARSTNRHL